MTPPVPPFPLWIPATAILLAFGADAAANSALAPTRAVGADAVARFDKEVRPILDEHCAECHADGEKEGSVDFDAVAAELAGKTDLWLAVLKNVRVGLMPPAKRDRMPAEAQRALEDWIKRGALGLDPANPDPGRVTLRRLNRVEYRNTIRDLMGIDFRADAEFPADDTGYGFDNIGDVLSTSPLLLEKYMAAAETIVAQAVPLVSRTLPERGFAVREFKGAPDRDAWPISLYHAVDVSHRVRVEKAGTYRVVIPATIFGSFDLDPGRAIVTASIDGREFWKRELKVDGQRGALTSRPR